MFDSLIVEFPKAKTDTDKVKLLKNLGQTSYRINSDTGLHYVFAALEMSKLIKWKKGMAMSFRAVATVYVFRADYAKALEYALQGLDAYEEINDKNGIASTQLVLGVIYNNVDDDGKSLLNYHKALKTFEALKDTDGMAIAVGNIGSLYYDDLITDSALKYYNMALVLTRKINDQHGTAMMLGNIGGLYAERKDYVAAIANQMEAYRYFRGINDNYYASLYLANLGANYISLATDTANKKLPGKMSDKNYLFAQARQALDTALVLGERVGDIRRIRFVQKNLSKLFTVQGKHKEALEAYKAAMQLQDSIFSQENRERIETLDKQREEDIKQKEIELQKVEIAKAKQERWFYVIGLVGLLVIVGLVTLFLFNTRKAKRLSDHLLHNILPVHTANELKANGSTKPRHYKNVSVLFTDFKEFAKLAEKLTADETVSLIHHYFTAFDKIVEQHGLEKIKTIGDAYMAACGVPVGNPNHALNAVNAAIAIRDFVAAEKMKRQQSGEQFFEIRIGVHSGPVVAGIVGVKKFAYDIWGDTVNLAARMESSGEPGRVNISGATYALIKDKFICHQRGNVQVKHGGLVEMYFVESELKEAVTV